MSSIAFTGHRPSKLGSYDPMHPSRVMLRKAMWEKIKSISSGEMNFITGGALGVDQDAARIAYANQIPFTVASPCLNQECKWPLESQINYRKMLSLANKVVYVTQQEYTSTCMQERNKWMVDNCDLLVAVWDGTKGGTYNCIRYAESVKKPIHYLKLPLTKT